MPLSHEAPVFVPGLIGYHWPSLCEDTTPKIQREARVNTTDERKTRGLAGLAQPGGPPQPNHMEMEHCLTVMVVIIQEPLLMG